MNTSTKDKILNYILHHEPVSPGLIAKKFAISRVMTHAHLNKLLKEGLIIRKGTSPRVYYFLNREKQREYDLLEGVNSKTRFLDNNFMHISADGSTTYGYLAFNQRCNERSINTSQAYNSFLSIIEKVDDMRDRIGCIDAFGRFQKQFPHIYIDGLRLLDVNQRKQFGKSRLSQLAFYGKLLQRYDFIQEVIQLTKKKVEDFIKDHNIDGICYAPPTIDRPRHQLMDELRDGYHLPMPEIHLTKIFAYGNKAVKTPQKSLSGTNKRIKNAEETIYIVGKQPKVKNLLLIDDFVASGATINISAKKIREKGLADNIYAIGLLGNIDFDYEVINEV